MKQILLIIGLASLLGCNENINNSRAKSDTEVAYHIQQLAMDSCALTPAKIAIDGNVLYVFNEQCELEYKVTDYSVEVVFGIGLFMGVIIGVIFTPR